MKINVVMPTLYGYRTNSYLPQVTEALIVQLEKSGYEYTLTTLGRDNPEYNKFTNDKIIKKYVGGLEGINTTRGMNAELAAMADEDIFCLFHDDLFIDHMDWVKMFVETYNKESLKCGVLGVLSHSQSVMGYVGWNLFEASYTNGNFFVKAKYIRCGFEEALAEECGDLDLCNEQMVNYRKNYIVCIPHRHYMTPYQVTFSYLKDFKKTLGRCRKHLNEKWLKRVPNNDWSKYK